MPLACGNSVILKASESCPRTHALIVEAFAEAGFPPGTVNLVTNAPADAGEVVGALIDAPEVKPEGENVEWIPGYWAWDDAEERYIWISGV